MKKKLLLMVLVSASVQVEASSLFKVLVRDEVTNLTRFENKQMEDLESQDYFDGKFFRIVNGKGKDAVSFVEKDPEILLKAATVYYHLSRARSYWVNELKSKRALDLPRLTVRLDIINQFDELGHFAHDNRSPQYNNALSIPEGETPSWVPQERQDKWGNEIWFRPMKSVLMSDFGPTGPNPITAGLMVMERPLINYLRTQATQRIFEQIFFPSSLARPLPEQLIRYAGTYAIFRVVLHSSKVADPLFIDKYYYLDTAMVPEVAYHEYAHVILSDHIKMTHSTPVVEGMADYFAAIMTKKRKIYETVPGRSNSLPKDTQEKKKYFHWDESNRLAAADFTLSVLWDVRETLGEDFGDKVVYQARTYIKTESSTISHGLLKAILRACDVECEYPARDKLKLYETFSERGF